ncbi:hypothetical protein L227DRAFT_651757 [Lentinus tigrinus ALCF2SS1-6]|uniref:F-box domain-containing protein n=1 Tax=Lentinus tigrinus ALCF2SS1-6 TaxID=1328759 RepID=A0A5C2SGK7_9APHY|nr:hypothetical protein L227DRAFT_651757 [Lentinus tigrinus ALCF2SS1-6]
MDISRIPDEERALFSGLTPAETRELAAKMQQDDETQIAALHERIMSLREHALAMKRVYNSAALIHAKLPVEILNAIFRMAGPWTSSRTAIGLTHVCHAWRTIIHGDPAFYVDLLDPPVGTRVFGRSKRRAEHSFTILDALSRSAPMRFNLTIDGDFIPMISSPAAAPHISRIRRLHLDYLGDDRRGMGPLFDLRLPSLEELELQILCRKFIFPGRRFASLSAECFPRLRILQTTCVYLAALLVVPSLRQLSIIPVEDEEESADEPQECWHLRSQADLFTMLEKTPLLEHLELHGCLPSTSPSPKPSPSPLLEKLKTFRLFDTTDHVRSLLEGLKLPDKVFMFVSTSDSHYDVLSEFLPITNRLAPLSSIDQMELHVHPPALPPVPLFVWGSKRDGDGRIPWPRLSVISATELSTESRPHLDLLRLFKGFAPLGSPSTLVNLKVTICKDLQRGQSVAWVWLLGHFTNLTGFWLVIHSSTDFFSAIAQENVGSQLSHLEVTLDGVHDDEGWVAEHEAMISTLELRASQGLRLDSFVYQQQIEGRLNEPPLLAPYEKRLRAVTVTGVSVLTMHFVDECLLNDMFLRGV